MKLSSLAITATTVVALAAAGFYFQQATTETPADPVIIDPPVPPRWPTLKANPSNRTEKGVVPTKSDTWKTTLAAFKEDSDNFDSGQLYGLVDAIPPEETTALLELLDLIPLGRNYQRVKEKAMGKLALESPNILLKLAENATLEQRSTILLSLFYSIPVAKLIPFMQAEAANLPVDFKDYLGTAVTTKSRADYFCDNPDVLKDLPKEAAAQIYNGILRTLTQEGADKEKKLPRFFQQLNPAAVEALGRLRLEEASVLSSGTVNPHLAIGVKQEMAKVDGSKLDSSIKTPLKASMLLAWSEVELDKASKWCGDLPEEGRAAILDYVKKMSPAAPLLSNVFQ